MEGNKLAIHKTLEGSKLTLELAGRLSTATVSELENELKREINRITDLVFDFTGVTYISSAGLRVLLVAQKTMNKRGRMRIIHVTKKVMSTFEITGFTDIMHVESDDTEE